MKCDLKSSKKCFSELKFYGSHAVGDQKLNLDGISFGSSYKCNEWEFISCYHVSSDLSFLLLLLLITHPSFSFIVFGWGNQIFLPMPFTLYIELRRIILLQLGNKQKSSIR